MPAKRRLMVTSDRAAPATEQHTRPCTDCPWARGALPGWLGGITAEVWIQAAHGETTIECHTLTGAQCAGAAIYRANMAKVCRSPAILRLPRDKVMVFAGPTEFLEHHKGRES